MNPKVFSEKILHWQGANAVLWTYSVSLSELHLRLQKNGLRGNLHVACSGVSLIKCLVSWRVDDLQAETINEGEYVVIDRSNGFEVRCKNIRILEDVDPVY